MTCQMWKRTFIKQEDVVFVIFYPVLCRITCRQNYEKEHQKNWTVYMSISENASEKLE